MEVKSFRLTLSDALVEGGQKVKTFNLGSGDIDGITIESLVDRLNAHFDFMKLIEDRKLSMDSLEGSEYLAVVGTDGSRHVPIRTDEQLVTFFKTVTNSKLPAIEIKLLQPGAPHLATTLSERRSPRDHIVEQLEARVVELEAKATLQVQQSVEGLERTQVADRLEAQKLVTPVGKDVCGKVEDTQQASIQESKVIQETKEAMTAEMDSLRKALQDIEKSNIEKGDKVLQQLDELNQKFERKFEEVQTDLENSRQTGALEGQEQKDEIQREGDELKRLAEEVKRLEEMLESKAPKADWQAAEQAMEERLESKAPKADWQAAEEAMEERLESKAPKADWQAAEEAMNLRINEELESVRNQMQSTDADLKGSMDKLQIDMESTSKTLATDCQATCQATMDRLSAMVKELEETVSRDRAKLVENLAENKQELEAMVKAEITTVSSTVEKRFAEMTTAATTAATRSGKELNECVSTLSARTEATFAAVDERMENLVKAERSRLGNIEKDLAESNAKLRSDCRSEVERVRVDYEQEAARLDADSSDLHMKHDVVKQEINFFQSRLLEQRDWAQGQLAETTTATRAAQVDAQEGVSACTRMAHTLRDDQVGFRDKMAKHISLLQHASDSYGDAINALETQRSRMKLELDAILGDHKSYVMDMDGWADDVRLKVERLFRAMEPPRCEWRVGGAVAKFKDLKKPLSIRSPSFGLQGLREVQMEFYPHGTNQSKDDKAMLRLCMPPGANVRYQCWLGRLTEGSREYKSGGSLSVDLIFESWKDQVLEDGGLNITMEVFQDLTNNDESLARAVHLET